MSQSRGVNFARRKGVNFRSRLTPGSAARWAKDVVSRTWRKIRTDLDAWSKRDPSGKEVVQLILDTTNMRVRLDRKGDQPVVAVRARGAA